MIDIVSVHLHVVHKLRRLVVRSVQVRVGLHVAGRRFGRSSICGEGSVSHESHGLHIVRCCKYMYLFATYLIGEWDGTAAQRQRRTGGLSLLGRDCIGSGSYGREGEGAEERHCSCV